MATRLDESDMDGWRMASVTSSPLRSTWPGGISSLVRPRNSTTRPASANGMSARVRARATARYMAPVSRYSNPSRLASPRAAVLFPDPAGPSIVMIMAVGVLTSAGCVPALLLQAFD